MSSVIPLQPRTATAEAIADGLARRLADTAAERDRAGGHAADARAWIRDSGLLTLTIPQALGGQGADWPTFYRTLRRLAEVDSAVAHVYAFHHLQLATVQLYGTAEQQAHFLRDTVAHGWFWGNALNPLDRRVVARPDAAGGWRLDGSKGFASGSVGSDRLVVSAWVPESQALVVGVVPTSRDGVTVQQDWDAFGQRQTDSGTVRFDGVTVAGDEVLQAPGVPPTPRATLRSQLAQLILVNLYVGLARGAYEVGRQHTIDHSRPWFSAGVARAVDDPFLQRRFGELRVQVSAAAALADAAVAQLDHAWRRGDALTAGERGEVALAVAEAKVLAHRAALDVGTEMFEATGARATTTRLGLDRFWRNARVHTLHDPLDYKLRDLGRHALTGDLPEPSPYS